MRQSLLCAAVVVLSACGRGTSVVADPVACNIPGLPNCTVSGSVTFGGQPSPAALQYVADRGYTTVVSIRGLHELNWDERAVVEALGMRFVQIPLENPVTSITDAEVSALDSVLAVQQGPLLLHCASGNRAGGLWGAWLAADRGVAPAAALRLAELAGMRHVRPALERRLAG